MPDGKSITAKEVGARIRSLREAQHDSQEKLAQTLNVSRELISKIESGRQYPSVLILARLSELYGVSTDYILFGINREKNLTQQLDRVIETLRTIRKSL